MNNLIFFNYEWIGVPETFFSVNSNYVQFLSAPHSSCCFQDKMIYFENIDFSPKTSLILTHCWRISITKLMLKVRQSRNDFFKPLFPPKNERRNSTVLLWYLRSTCFRSFFWRKSTTPKNHFEINWPLPQVNFPDNNLNFQWRWMWWDQTQAILLNIFYFTFKNVFLRNSGFQILD